VSLELGGFIGGPFFIGSIGVYAFHAFAYPAAMLEHCKGEVPAKAVQKNNMTESIKM
jgi:hypothetical protein